MSTAAKAPARRSGLSRKSIITGAALLALVVAMAVDTRVVVIGSDEDVQAAGFQPEVFGAEQFPIVRDFVQENAVEATELAAAVQEDQTAAGQEYGVGEGFGPVIPVTFTGVAGEATAGIYNVEVEGMPEGMGIRVQTGPAINGTELRDATGEIEFGQFTNQIEYQDAGSAINNEMKVQVLEPIDTSDLTGKSITVTGAFKLINPNNWLVTPVSMSVE
ncbi:DUF2291 family protein [Pelagovum pacificum]|uniref:DUF2291 domain-containing protein n=1 Tax=Pelagovum pacificum TaxID=2588711 RepID=A0A5C5GCA7_9RHOB|nr:DUF2291 domain-containing protein [Pelagovum pacificum]QQA41423.1 DUF2291 domain-containing protein [Pelagovum pacificum]TNY31774.1 DUF2291 domain-containing protein [Pelagovum pacificum]